MRPEGLTGEGGTTPQADAIVPIAVESELDWHSRASTRWSDAVLAREQYRFDEVGMAPRHKIHELHVLLPARLHAIQHRAACPDITCCAASSERWSARERRPSLQAVRRQMHDDLLRTPTWVWELVTMIDLAKYTERPRPPVP